MNRTFVLSAIVFGSTALGCGSGDDGDVGVDSSDVEPRITYSGDIRALVETNCTGCHFAGGPAPFAFETYEEVSAASSVMLDSITSGRMPPWPADPSCRSYANERGLTPEEITTFEAWLDEGAPQGEPTEPIAVVPAELEATHAFSAAAPYTPDFSAEGDDYRCFLLDADFDAPAWVQGSTVAPATAAVHHVLVYALDAEQAAQAEALDAADEGEGYTCFGGPLPADGSEGNDFGGALQVTQLAGWVPGSEPNIIPPQLGIPIDAGSRVVMQIHYSAVGGDSVADQTQLQLQLTETPPQSVMRTVPLAIPELQIPAGEDDVTFTSTLTNWSDRPVDITSLTGHMHLLGKSISAHVEHADGGQTCGLSIPQWDFDWQLSYDLPEQEQLTVAPGDGVKLTCSYDNTAQNQQVIDGQQLEPRDVQWGDGSLDEMCLVYATVIEPYEAPDPGVGEGACAAASECFGASDGSLTGLFGCESASSVCAICALEAGTTCGLTPCLLALASARECIAECILSTTAFGGTLGRCLEASCGEAYDELTSCADPVVQSGACDEAFATSCGLDGGG
ncbi:MAG: hypothetical protein AB1Z98_07860 [Nannocystaceae bacterium]